MVKFEVADLTCEGCGAVVDPARWRAPCPICLHSQFTVQIERSSSGIDEAALAQMLVPGGGWVGAFMREATDDGPASIRFKTHSFLQCQGVSGTEIVSFLSASVEDRRRLYIAWKRREIEATLDSSHRICGRCQVKFRAYSNDWNQAGFCSRVCREAESKSR